VAYTPDGTWVGGFPCLIDPKYRNPVFWQHEYVDDVIELMDFHEYGVLDAGTNYKWLIGADVCLKDWSWNKGAQQGFFTFLRAQREGQAAVSYNYSSFDYVVPIKHGDLTWHQLTPKKFVKEIDKALAATKWQAKLVSGAEAEPLIDEVVESFQRRWLVDNRDATARYREGNLKCLRDVLVAACAANLALVSVMRLDSGESSIEVGIYNNDVREYIVPFVNTETTKAAPLGAMHMAWTMDAVGSKLGALTYSQGSGEVEFKLKWAPRIVPNCEIITLNAKSPELARGEVFTWDGAKLATSKRNPKFPPASAMPQTVPATRFGRKRLLNDGETNERRRDDSPAGTAEAGNGGETTPTGTT
jgi:hypothetical protein